MTIVSGSLSSISIASDGRLAMVEGTVGMGVGVAVAVAIGVGVGMGMGVAGANAAREEEEEAGAGEGAVGGPRGGEFEVNGRSVSPEERTGMRASFAGGCERVRSLALEVAFEFALEAKCTKCFFTEVVEEEVEDAFGEADDAFGTCSSRNPRFSRRKRRTARSRGSVMSSGASGGRGGRSPGKKEAVG